MKVIVLLASGLVWATFPCYSSEDWRLLSETEIWKLSVDQGALRRNGEKVYVRYLLEHPIAYENKLTKRRYRGTVVQITIDCKARTITLGDLASYAQPGAGGPVVDRFTASGVEAQPRPIVVGGTDEILWRHACRRDQ